MFLYRSADLYAIRDEFANRTDADKLLLRFAADNERRGLTNAELLGHVHVLLDHDLAISDPRLIQQLFRLLAVGAGLGGEEQQLGALLRRGGLRRRGGSRYDRGQQLGSAGGGSGTGRRYYAGNGY